MHQLAYALELAWRGLRRSPYITLLSVFVLALGMGGTISAFNVTQLLAGNPLPDRSGSLYRVYLNPAGLQRASDISRGIYGNNVVTLLDARQIEAAARTIMQTALINTHALTISAGEHAERTVAQGIHGLEVQSDFFPMFDVPLVTGHRWSRADDASAAPVVVISQRLARKLFGDAEAVGKMVRISRHSFRVVGVTGLWKVYPHFYGLMDCVYVCKSEEVFIPISAARAARIRIFQESVASEPGTPPACYRADNGLNADRCPYLGLWALLPTVAQRAKYRTMLAHYASAQKKAGRITYGGKAGTGLHSIRDVLDAQQVVPLSARFSVWVTVVFLLICLVSVAGLLLTRNMRGAVELGIRRALGAPRSSIFAQCLIEGGLVGLSGGVVAVPLVWVGLWLVHQMPTDYAHVVRFDWPAIVMLLILASACGALIGAVPAWRATTVDAGLQVKEQ